MEERDLPSRAPARSAMPCGAGRAQGAARALGGSGRSVRTASPAVCSDEAGSRDSSVKSTRRTVQRSKWYVPAEVERHPSGGVAMTRTEAKPPVEPRAGHARRGLLYVDPRIVEENTAPRPRRTTPRASVAPPRAQQKRTSGEVHRLNAELQTIEHRLRSIECTDDLCALDLYHDQKLFMNGSLSLLELLQQENRTKHARQLPELHTVLTRTWKVGIELALDQLYDMLAHTDTVATPRPLSHHDLGEDVMSPHCILVEVVECTLCNAYALCACLYEMSTELRVRRACVEWLGDLACRQLAFLQFLHASQGVRRGRSHRRHASVPDEPELAVGRYRVPDEAQLAIQGFDLSRTHGSRSALREEYDAWQTTAYLWYGMATRDTPNEGHLYTSLAQLSSSDELMALYYFCKSLQVVHPSTDARELMQEYFSQAAQKHRTRPDASVAELVVYLHGVLATRTDMDDASHALARLASHFHVQNASEAAMAYSGTRYPHILLETQWMMIGLCTVAALFEFGRADAFVDIRLLAAYRTPSDARLFSEKSLASVTALLERDTVPIHEERPEASACDAALAAGVPPPTAHALGLLVELVQIAAALQHEALHNTVAHINAPTAFLVLVFAALHALALHVHESDAAATLCAILRTHLPWKLLLEFGWTDVFPSDNGADVAEVARHVLPEDWCFKGIAWNTFHATFPDSIPRRGGASAQAATPPTEVPSGKSAFTFSSETNMFGDLGAMARHFASLKTHSYLSAYAQDPDLQQLLRVRHARYLLLLAGLYTELGQKGYT